MINLTRLDVNRDCNLVAHYVRRWRDYSLSFHIEALQAERFGTYPTFQQYELCCLRDKNRFVAAAAARGVGKTRWLAGEVFRFLLCYRLPGKPTKIPITGPSGGQLSDVIWAEIASVRECLLPWLSDRFRMTTEHLVCIENPENWFATPRTAKKEASTNLQGQHGSTCNIYDEVSGIHDEIMNVTVSSMTEDTAHALMMGNPDRLSGYFYRVFNKMKKTRWVKYYMSAYGSLTTEEYVYPYVDPFGESHEVKVRGRVTPQWIEDQKNEFGEDSAAFAAYVKGVFPKSEENSLIKNDWVNRAWNRELEPIQKNRKRILGIDAGYERDPMCYLIRCGNNIEYCELKSQMEPLDSFVFFEDLFFSFEKAGKRIDMVAIDGNGIGYGLYKEIQRHGYNVRNILTQESAPKWGMKCRRKRDSLWWQMRTYFRDYPVCFLTKTEDCETLCEELKSPTYRIVNGFVEVESKDKMRGRGLSSPNAADALANTFDVDSILPDPPKPKKKLDIYSRKRRRAATSWLLA